MREFLRRQFLITGTAAGAAIALGHTWASSLRAEAPKRELGIQLYSVAAELAADTPGTLMALNRIGYRTVETAGTAGIPVKDFRKKLDDDGLTCPSAHLEFSAADPSPLFDDAHILGAKYAVSSALIANAPTPPSAKSTQADIQAWVKALSTQTPDDFKRTADLANSIGSKARQAGLQYAYHNHNFEFKDQGNGQIGYDLLLRNTDPNMVKFELDCGWMVAAGFNPVDYFHKYPDRYRMIHVRDFLPGLKPTFTAFGPDGPKGTELGRGHIDYRPIFPAAAAGGVEYYFSEQEPPITSMTALQAAKVNYDYMRSLN